MLHKIFFFPKSECTIQLQDRLFDLKLSFGHNDPNRTDLNRQALKGISYNTNMRVYCTDFEWRIYLRHRYITRKYEYKTQIATFRHIEPATIYLN